MHVIFLELVTAVNRLYDWETRYKGWRWNCVNVTILMDGVFADYWWLLWICPVQNFRIHSKYNRTVVEFTSANSACRGESSKGQEEWRLREKLIRNPRTEAYQDKKETPEIFYNFLRILVSVLYSYVYIPAVSKLSTVPKLTLTVVIQSCDMVTHVAIPLQVCPTSWWMESSSAPAVDHRIMLLLKWSLGSCMLDLR